MKRIVALLLVCILVPVCAGADMSVWFLDVGQGDCTVVVCDGQGMIIDGGPPVASDKVFSFLKDLGLERLEYMILTHPHEDHYGGLAGALRAVEVENFLSPVVEWNKEEFADFMKAVEIRESLEIIPYEGQQFPLGESVFTILHCWPEAPQAVDEEGKKKSAVDPVNDMSIVLRIDYGETSVMITGDAESASEYMMIDSGLPLRADVLRVGHHGSASSTSEEFLSAVSPRYAVISCGKRNQYGHPHSQVLDLLKDNDVWLFRTDLQGTVRCESDGKKISFTVERLADREKLYKAP